MSWGPTGSFTARRLKEKGSRFKEKLKAKGKDRMERL
jgi:hypothetical protein